MKVLLDTNVLIWSVHDTQRLGKECRELIRDPGHDVAFSPVSIWEIAIKSALRRADFKIDPEGFLEAVRLDFRELPIVSSTTIRAAALPNHHRDPFDRLLIAQAMEEDAILLTADQALAMYGPQIRLA